MKTESSTANSILVMGVGRSGTTAIYGLLQHILEDRYPGDVDFVYEPFLWDRKTFNKQYTDLTDEFQFVASLSVEGMYHHKRIPMLVDQNSTIDQNSFDWLAKTLSPVDKKRHYLGKMIRANGRIRAVREVAPNTKIICIIRNPVDVLNSASQMFSFYGEEFYESDFGRFAAEVASQFGEDIRPKPGDIPGIEAEYAYWYFSNLVFLEYAKKNPQQILTIAYEAFIENRSNVVSRICDFAGIECHPDFATAAGVNFGPVQQKYNGLTQLEFLYLHGKVRAYKELLECVNVVPSIPVDTLVKTTWWNESEQIDIRAQHFNAHNAGHQLRQKELQLAELRIRLTQISDELSNVFGSKRYQFINWILTPFDKLKEFRVRRKAN